MSNDKSIEYCGYPRTGRTTALAFKYLAEAILRKPGWVEVVDHFGTKEANLHLLKKMCGMAMDLSLVFEFDWTRLRVRTRYQEYLAKKKAPRTISKGSRKKTD